MIGVGCVSRPPSYDPKKNSLFFHTGPPITPPNSFCRSGGCCGTPLFGGTVFRNQSLASSTLFRRYSNTDPWNRLVPVRVTIETCPPGVRPNSGANVDVWILNSWMASIDARLLKPPVGLGCTPDPEGRASTLAPAPTLILALTPSTV